MDRNDLLYRAGRNLAKESLDWDSPGTVIFQHEMRIDYVEHMPTLDLISTVLCDEEDVVDWSMTLAQIHSLDAQAMDLDDALGQGRR